MLRAVRQAVWWLVPARSYRPDTSRVPTISEDDLEERFIRGSGPGGQAINKTANCVVLKHLPTVCSTVAEATAPSVRSPWLVAVRSYRPDTSLVPALSEDDLEEKFVRGSGPGGSAVNKNTNCVVLKHTPTGIVVKCHDSRLLHQNRELARKLLITKLDNHFNGEFSVENQLKEISKKKSNERQRRSKRMNSLKQQWKEREDIK